MEVWTIGLFVLLPSGRSSKVNEGGPIVTIDERLEALTQSLELLGSMQIHAAERHGLDVAELRDGEAKLRESQVRTENTLRRAIRLAVQDARRQRNRNQAFEETMVQIGRAQLENEQLLKENEQLLKAFLERGGNGKH